MKTKWEYKTVREFIDLYDKLNELGAEGWELVTAFQPRDDGVWFIFKRKVSK